MTPNDRDVPIAITGAAGLVGANLITLLIERGYRRIVALDRNAGNLDIVSRLHPTVTARCVDLAEPGDWERDVAAARVVFQLHAQIAAKTSRDFERNNVIATRRVLEQVDPDALLVHISSSVVRSVADDDYVRTKTEQERLVHDSGLRYAILRPTLMFGWFDGKHLGWLARFMKRVPVFPIPGHGEYVRQPLYCRDFCHALVAVMERDLVEPQPAGRAWDLTGPEDITYIDIIRAIRDIQHSRTAIVRLPYGVFDRLLRVYAVFSKKPPFTSDQLAALVAGDHFEGVDIAETFGFEPTPFATALRETLTHPRYSAVTLGSPH